MMQSFAHSELISKQEAFLYSIQKFGNTIFATKESLAAQNIVCHGFVRWKALI